MGASNGRRRSLPSAYSRRRRPARSGPSSPAWSSGGGTRTTPAIPGFSVAGKTGTAQKAGPGGYQKGRYVPNFVGFVPADNPRVVAVVVVEEPKGKYYARDVAAPLFARVVSQALDILRVAPAEQRLPATVLASAAAG